MSVVKRPSTTLMSSFSRAAATRSKAVGSMEMVAPDAPVKLNLILRDWLSRRMLIICCLTPMALPPLEYWLAFGPRQRDAKQLSDRRSHVNIRDFSPVFGSIGRHAIAT